jgi:hypothetical protein
MKGCGIAAEILLPRSAKDCSEKPVLRLNDVMKLTAPINRRIINESATPNQLFSLTLPLFSASFRQKIIL